MSSLTLQELKSLLAYDPDTGNLTWLNPLSVRVKPGDRAGSVSGQGYVTVRIKGTLYYAHRLAFLFMTGKWPEKLVDHIDGDRKNNRWSNLREATRQENAMNLHGAHADSATGVLGVSKRGAKFRAYITVDGKQKHLGYHETEEEASEAYQAQKQVLHEVVA